MATPRGGLPFVYVTGLTGILAGEQQCTYASWFKAKYRYTKRPDETFNLAAWTTDHTRLLQRRAEELQAEGWRVRLENENAFRLKGDHALLAGKPDLIATRDGVVRIVDAKTGQPKNRDWHQVLIYLFAVPRVWPELRGHAFEGEVYYQTHRIPIGGHELTAERIAAIAAAIRAVAAAIEPVPVPSAAECRWCDVADCTVRIESAIAEATVAEGF